MPVIPLECPSCGIGLRIDSDESAAICTRCGKPFVVNEAIVQNYIKLVTEQEASKEKALAFEEFVIEDGVLKRYNGSSPEVIIPDEVTVIGSKAFEDRKEIVELSLPDSVVGIEDNAFSGCDNLKKVSFSDSLKKIGNYAFSECSSLLKIELPSSVEEVGSYAFTGCFSLGSVKMPSPKTNIHETAFMGDKDVRFEWPDDWADKQWDKLKLVAPTQGGLISICDSEDSDGDGAFSESLLFMGVSDLGMYIESSRYNFYTYKAFMRLFSIGANNNDPYLLRMSVENASQRYDAIADIQKSYSELIGLLDRARISRSKVKTINIPHFILKQGKGLNDFKITDIGMVPVLQIKLVQK